MELGIAVVGNVEPYGYYCQALLLYGQGKMLEFALGEQEFAVSCGLVAVPAAPEVRRNIHPLYIKLPVREIAECVLQRCLAGAQALYLRADQHYTGIVSLDEFIVETRALVAYLYAALCLGHNGLQR